MIKSPQNENGLVIFLQLPEELNETCALELLRNSHLTILFNVICLYLILFVFEVAEFDEPGANTFVGILFGSLNIRLVLLENHMLTVDICLEVHIPQLCFKRL